MLLKGDPNQAPPVLGVTDANRNRPFATLAPAQIWAWLGVVFAVVIIGRLGNPLGALLAGMLIGASESIAMAVFAPAWAPVVSFSVLIAILLWDPEWL